MEEGGSSTIGNNVKQEKISSSSTDHHHQKNQIKEESEDDEESSSTGTGSDYDSSQSPLNSSIDILSPFSKHVSKRKEGPQISADNSPKSTKRKERHPGSGSTQKTAADLGDDCIGEAGRRFTSHILNLKAGEDVAENILNLSRACKRQSVIILSASGTVSNVTLRVPDGGDASFTYQGIFHLLSLSGSYIFTTKPARGHRRRKEMLFSILMSDINGKVFGGSIANSLIAAGPLQVVVGTFKQEGYKEPKENKKSNESSPVVAAPPPKVFGGNSNSDKVIFGEDSKIFVEGHTNCPSPTSGFLPTTHDDQAANNQAATHNDHALNNQAATHDDQDSNNQAATHDDQAATHGDQAANNKTAIHDDQAAANNQTATHDDEAANNLDNNSIYVDGTNETV